MSKNFYIIGGGFGLYGYLPALIKIKKKVSLDEKYKQKIISRSDISNLSNKIKYLSKFPKNKSKNIIFAKRPIDQYKFIIKNKINSNLYLEKPIAPNPTKSIKLIKYLKKQKIIFKVAYLFFYCEWFKILNSKKNISINWSFKSKSFVSKNWKSNEKKGGGIINFYGIHLIALISKLGNFVCQSSHKSKNVWRAKYKYNEKIIKVKININKKEIFIIKSVNEILYKASSPFYKKKLKNKIDPRVIYLTKYLKEKKQNINHDLINKLWDETLKKTKV